MSEIGADSNIKREFFTGMEVYDAHAYCELLDYIEDGCKKIGEDRKFSEHLKSMKSANSLEELIAIYNNVLKLLSVIYFGKGNVPVDWYNFKRWGYNYEVRAKTLADFLNENIISLLKRSSITNSDECIRYIVNIRVSSIERRLQKRLFESIDEELLKRHSKWHLKKIHSVLAMRNSYYNYQKTVCNLNSNINHNQKMVMSIFKELVAKMKIYGHIFDVVELSLAKDYNINYEELAHEYAKSIERQKAEKLKLDIEQKKEKRKYKIIACVGIAILVVILCSLAIYKPEVAFFIALVVVTISLFIKYGSNTTSLPGISIEDALIVIFGPLFFISSFFKKR